MQQIAVIGQKLPFQQGEDVPFPGFHPFRFSDCAPLMIVAEQMQDAVQQQKYQFMLEGNSRVRRVRRRSFRGNHHIPQQQRLQAAPFPFLHGEGDDVGRPVALQIITIEPLNALIIQDQDRQFRLRISRDA
jgi:hypothetical protein